LDDTTVPKADFHFPMASIQPMFDGMHDWQLQIERRKSLPILELC
jgi:hypothetical protein